MRATLISIICITGILLILSSCSKQETETLEMEPVSDYLPLIPGKFIIYRLDSMIFTENGRKEEARSYQEKLEVSQQLTDNLGRTTYRVNRVIRDVAGQNNWSAGGALFVTPYDQKIEVTSDNIRVLRLISPLSEGTTWKPYRHTSSGTPSTPHGPYSSLYDFHDDSHNHIQDWEFTYTSKNESVELNGKTIHDVITVSGPDEALNAPVTDAASFGSRTYSIDKYAKNIGLVYQELIMWEYQPNPNGSPFKVGFGVKRSLLDHN
jgi:hypothetical protein